MKGSLSHLTLTRGLLRSLVGVHPAISGRQASPVFSHHRASLSALAHPALSSQEEQWPSPPSSRRAHTLSNSGVRSSRRAAAGSQHILAFDPKACRKRLPGWRHLSTRASDTFTPSCPDGGNGGNGKAQDDCWKCNSTVGWRDYFCTCGAAQPLDEHLDYFEMFGCSPSVFLDLKAVEKKFKNMQRAFHPDLFASKCDGEQAISAANSATANKAYETLVRPMRRVKYLMQILGSQALEEGTDDRTPVPPDFLMEVMEIRESLEHCSSKDEAEAILSQSNVAVEECLHSMDETLKAGGGRDELADAAVRLRYLYRIEDEARTVMHRLEDER